MPKARYAAMLRYTGKVGKVARVGWFADDERMRLETSSIGTHRRLLVSPCPFLYYRRCCSLTYLLHTKYIQAMALFDNHGVFARQALDRVNEEAMKRAACGIAFLGDFWHARGSLKVIHSSGMHRRY